MNIGLRLHDTPPAPIADRIAGVRQQGFSCIQLAPKKAILDYDLDNGSLTPGLSAHIKKHLHQNEVDLAVLGCYLNLADPDGVALEQNFRTYEAHLRFAAFTGAYMLGTETGAVNSGYIYEPANHTQASLDILVKNLGRVVALAEKLGVVVGIEPVFKHIVYDMEVAVDVIRRIGSPNLQIIFDPVNLLNSTNCLQEEAVIDRAIRIGGDHIACLHLKDYRLENGQILELPAGTGVFRYEKLMDWVMKKKPWIHLLLEETNVETAQVSRAFIEQLGVRRA